MTGVTVPIFIIAQSALPEAAISVNLRPATDADFYGVRHFNAAFPAGN